MEIAQLLTWLSTSLNSKHSSTYISYNPLSFSWIAKMVELQDTVIKLFGKKISLPEISKTCLAAKKVEEQASKDQNLAEESVNPKAVQISKDDESDTKALKKPDKIIACPRCNSTDTKFCYYNNYNTNQPRHFCKSCQRYWTNGGTMRNVPVGSGRRKNKNHLSASYYLPNHEESLEVAPVVSKILVPNFNSNGKILCFDAAPHGIQDPKVQNIHGFLYPSGLPWPYPVYPVHNPWITGSTVQVLGKRSRDEEFVNKNNMVPGVDGPVKSLICREGLFQGFEAQCGKKMQMIESVSPALQANPAAMSRSLNFKERA